MATRGYDIWLSLALLSLTISVFLKQVFAGGALLDFGAGLFLGLALALNLGYLIRRRETGNDRKR